MRTFDLLEPTTVEEALALYRQYGDDARLIAGGAMLSILLRQRLIEPRVLISLAAIPGLSGIERTADGLRLGATTTLRAIERSALVRELHPTLTDAAHLVGNVRVRTVATLGGHLAQADVHLDLPPVLVALGASSEVQAVGTQRQVPIDKLFVGYYETSLEPGEIITAVTIPRPPAGLVGVYLKYCSLSPNDWPTVGVAAFLRPVADRATDIRLVAGSVADQPLRLPEAEQLLEGAPLRRSVIREVAERYAAAAQPLADVRGSEEYKRRMTAVFVQRALEQVGARTGLPIIDP